MFLELAARDLGLREQLVSEGKLFGGYHPEMEALHVANGRILQHYLSEHGWPEADDESKAAWLVLVHAISMPELQKSALAMFRKTHTGVPKAMIGTLEDRVLTLSGGKQKYGTQWDWDESGTLNPYPLQDSENIDQLRASIGLDTLEERGQLIRQRAEEEGESAIADRDQYLLERLQWMAKVGWITSPDDVDPAYKPTWLHAPSQ